MKLVPRLSRAVSVCFRKPFVQRCNLPCSGGQRAVGYLKTRTMFSAGFSDSMQDFPTVGFLGKQTNKIIPVPQATSSLPLYQSSVCLPSTTDAFNISFLHKWQENSFPTTRESVLLPRHSQISEICDPSPVISGLTIGDSPQTTGPVSHSDVEQNSTGEMLASSVLKKRKEKMNKHKYKKRRARDKFKRLNLQNIKDRKQRAKDRAKERMKSSA